MLDVCRKAEACGVASRCVFHAGYLDSLPSGQAFDAATALLVSQPLHFGDYGGMPMKILWATLDGLTIIVLGSGVYLWVVRRKAVKPVLENAESAA